MNAFESASLMERRGMVALLPFLEENSAGRMVVTNKGRLAPFIQEVIGDVIYNDRSGRMWTVEIKTDGTPYSNIFLETWSNRNLEDAASHAERGQNVGWLAKLKSDLLFYYFVERDDLYVFNLLGLKRWAFGCAGRKGRIYDFEEKLQGKHKQMNDTWGRCVPISVLLKEVRPTPKLLHPQQLNLWPENAA